MSAPCFEVDRWVPDPGRLEDWRVGRFMARHGCADYAELHARSVADPEWFYRAAFEDLDLPWPVPWQRLCDDDADGVPWRRWFIAGRTNLAELAVGRWARRTPDAAAIIAETEEGVVRTLTFSELDDAVRRVAGGLRALGVARGDVVALYLPMVPEAAIALLGVARMGAIVAPAFSGYGVDALAERLRIADAKVLVAADGYLRRGRAVDALAVARQARALAPSVEHIVVVDGLTPGETHLRDGELLWGDLVGHEPEVGAPELFAADVPFLVAFTSGSTGRPKGTLHTHGGLPYRWAIDSAYSYEIRQGDRYTWLSDMGWIMGPLAITGSLVLGASLVLLESFDFPGPERLWEQVERHGITFLGLSPTIARLLAAAGDEPVDRSDLSSLRTIGTTGEPMTPPAWRWLHRVVGRGRVPIINGTGGTEVGGAFLTGSPVVATPECRFSGPALAIDADVVDADWNPVVGVAGELVVRSPWPSMTRGFFNEGPERYEQTYWSRLPGTWVHGDRAIRYPDGTWELPGRSDDLIKVAGKRVGPVEFESIAMAVDGVEQAIAVGVGHELKGEVVVVLVSGPQAEEPEVRTAVADRIGLQLGKPLRPQAVLAVGELPLLRSGKLHRRAARAWLTGADPGDLSSLANSTAEAAVRAAAGRLSR